MADEDNVLFIRSNNEKNIATDTDDVWDDTVLIKAYDKAVTLARAEVARRMGLEAPSSSQEKNSKSQHHKQNHPETVSNKRWVVGAPCRAVYSEDGEMYEAVVTKVHKGAGTCIVKFVGYGNTEKVAIDALHESEGLVTRTIQEQEALQEKGRRGSFDSGESAFTANSKKYNFQNGDKMEYDTGEPKRAKNNFGTGPPPSSVLGMMPPAPPLPPQLMSRLPENDTDALSSMLMSWYISGFHTGYYHGLKQARDNHEKQKK